MNRIWFVIDISLTLTWVTFAVINIEQSEPIYKIVGCIFMAIISGIVSYIEYDKIKRG